MKNLKLTLMKYYLKRRRRINKTLFKSGKNYKTNYFLKRAGDSYIKISLEEGSGLAIAASLYYDAEAVESNPLYDMPDEDDEENSLIDPDLRVENGYVEAFIISTTIATKIYIITTTITNYKTTLKSLMNLK